MDSSETCVKIVESEGKYTGVSFDRCDHIAAILHQTKVALYIYAYETNSKGVIVTLYHLLLSVVFETFFILFHFLALRMILIWQVDFHPSN